MPDANSIASIDIVLEPDATMVAQIEAVKERLAAESSNALMLDPAKRAQLVVLREHVRVADLDDVCRAVEPVLAGASIVACKLAASKYSYSPGPPIRLGGLSIIPTPELLWLHKGLADAVAPYAERCAADRARLNRARTPSPDAEADAMLERLIPEGRRRNLEPEMSFPVETIHDLDRLLAAVFKPFSFSPSFASIYRAGVGAEPPALLKTVSLTPKRGLEMRARDANRAAARINLDQCPPAPARTSSAGRSAPRRHVRVEMVR